MSIVGTGAKGRVVELMGRVNADDPTNAALVIAALKAAGLEPDATLEDYDTFADVLAAANDEATNAGYARKILDDTDGIVITPDYTNNWTTITIPEQTWVAVAAAGGAWGKLMFGYDPDSTGGTDAAIEVLTFNDFAVTPDGNDIVTTTLSTTGFFKARNP